MSRDVVCHDVRPCCALSSRLHLRPTVVHLAQMTERTGQHQHHEKATLQH